jgi:hypothetical protein
MLRFICASQVSVEVLEKLYKNSSSSIKKVEEKQKANEMIAKKKYFYETLTRDNNMRFYKKMDNEKLFNRGNLKFYRSLHKLVKDKIKEE